jgi:GntR family transcriptional regulator / MocR family aminotransferase
MGKPWATFGTDLHLEQTGPHVRAGLEEALRDAVRSGRLPTGTRVPSSRQLAGDLGIARNTVGEAYGQLVAEGWLTSRPGAGTWVSEQPLADRTAGAVASPKAAAAVRYDLRPGAPDLSAFPRSGWLSAARRALNTTAYDAFGYADPRGLPVLREALAGYLARVRGVSVTPDRIVVCAGFAQGLELLCEVLRGRGATTMATEAYGLERDRQLIAAKGLGIAGLEVDQEGAVVDDLGDADAVLLTPAHQFPLGVPLSPKRRRRAVEWAVDGDRLIIEDDYDGEFRYDRRAVGSMQSLAPEYVVYGGTTSKSLVPGLRLGWLVLPAGLLDDVVEAKRTMGRLSSAFDQLTLAEFITSHGYDRSVRRARLAYRRRRDRLAAALSKAAPRTRLLGVPAGLHALVGLPDGGREADIVALGARHGLGLEGIEPYCMPGHRHDPALVIGYATPPEHLFTAALARLCAVLGSDHDGAGG